MSALKKTLIGALSLVPAAVFAGTPTTIGWIETVAVEGIAIEAKIDTGADFTSVGVVKIEEFRRRGANWVRFSVRGADLREHVLERPIERHASIKRVGGGTQLRPVVWVSICVGDQLHVVQANLLVRENMEYSVLVGRNFLAGRFLVDSARMHVSDSGCKQERQR